LAAGYCSKNLAFVQKIMALPESGGLQPYLTLRPVPEKSINFWQLLWQSCLQAACPGPESTYFLLVLCRKSAHTRTTHHS